MELMLLLRFIHMLLNLCIASRSTIEYNIDFFVSTHLRCVCVPFGRKSYSCLWYDLSVILLLYCRKEKWTTLVINPTTCFGGIFGIKLGCGVLPAYIL